MSSNLLPELWNLIFLLFKAPHLLRSAALVCRLWHTRSWKALCSSGIRLSTRHLASALSRLQAIGFIHQIQHLTLEIPRDHGLQLDLGFLASFLSLRSLKIVGNQKGLDGLGGLQACTALRELALSGFLLDSPLASALTSLTRIESLKFDDFEIEPDGLPFLPLLTQLRAFHLVFSREDASMDQVIEHITGLTNLESFPSWGHAAPSRMALLTSLPHLRHLDVLAWREEPDLSWLPRLHLTSLEAPFSEHIAGIGSLQELTVSRGRPPPSLEPLAPLRSLTRLTLGYLIDLDDSICRSLEVLPQLRHLSFSESTSSELSPLTSLTHLVSLEDRSPSLDLPPLPTLTSLTLGRDLTPACAASLTSLKHLDLHSGWTHSTLHRLPALSRLESFTGWGQDQLIPDIELHPLAECKHLTRLQLRFMHLPPSGLTFLTALSHLRHLELLYCDDFTSRDLGHMTQLRELEIIHLMESSQGEIPPSSRHPDLT